jgi:hypothetical protein
MGQEILFSIDNCKPYQVFRLKAEGYKTSHKARINPFNRALKNKHQAVSQGVWRFGKRSIFVNM